MCIRSDQNPRGMACIRTAIERSSGPLYSVFVFLARHLLGPLAREKRADKRGHGVFAIHRLLGCIKCAIYHVLSAGSCDAGKTFETRTGEPLWDKTYCRSRDHCAARQIYRRSLRTRREDVDKETAGDDGILNNLVCLTGELHILFRCVSDQGENSSEAIDTYL